MFVMCFSIARGVTTSASAMAWLERPSAISESTSRSRALSTSSGLERRLRATRRPTIDGSSAEPPSATRAHRVGEVVDVGDAVLEQVADAVGALREQLHRVLGLGVLREHDDAHARVRLADAPRGAHALVGVRRRHADVDHGDVRLERADRVHQVDGVLGLCDDLEARIREHACDALAHECGIVGDRDAQRAHHGRR